MSVSPSLSSFNNRSFKRTYDFFASHSEEDTTLTALLPLTKKPKLTELDQQNNGQDSSSIKLSARILSYYKHVKDMTPPVSAKKSSSNVDSLTSQHSRVSTECTVSDVTEEDNSSLRITQHASSLQKKPQSTDGTSTSQNLIKYVPGESPTSSALTLLGVSQRPSTPWEDEKPQWHAPWKLQPVIAGHNGWVRCVTVDPTNHWFATGSADKTIKIWDLAQRKLMLTLPGHTAGVRSVVASDRHPYLFSGAEDKLVFCWDLESNKKTRDFFGHKSSIYTVALHPALDLVFSGSRDKTVKVWDVRARHAIHTLTGHRSTVFTLDTQAAEPQVISGAADATIICWDLVAGKIRSTLTNHQKTVRSLLIHPTENTMASAAADAIKKWKLPDGNFIHNFSSSQTETSTDPSIGIVNTLALNHENVLVAGGDNGSLHFWDYKTGHLFQQTETIAQVGSLASERGILAAAFDKTGSRLITCEADKSIKIWIEDQNATELTHPLSWKPKKHKVQW